MNLFMIVLRRKPDVGEEIKSLWPKHETVYVSAETSQYALNKASIYAGKQSIILAVSDVVQTGMKFIDV